MKHLYPAIARIGLTIALIIYNVVANSQTLNFNNPVIESGTDLQPGCVYRFKSVTTNGLIDALVTIDSLVAVTLSGIDATPSGSSSTAFQPQVSSLGDIGYHYSVFTISFVNKGTTTPATIYNYSSVFMGLDGSNQMMEFNAITISNATWQYCSSTPQVAVTQTGNQIWGTATNSTSTGGQGVDENDSTQMFRVSSASTSSVTIRVGYNQIKHGWNGNDLFSLNMAGSEIPLTLLPVTLVSFTTQLANEKVWLAWATKQEDNLSYYSIERSFDNKEFEQVALLFPAEDPSTGNNYSYKDPVNNIKAPVIYYRLKMVDKDGKYKYSETRTVRMTGTNSGSAKLTTWPNPVVNELHVSAPPNWYDQTVSCQLLNTMGSIIKSFNMLQSATIRMADVPAGTYYLKVANGKDISTQTIIKSRN